MSTTPSTALVVLTGPLTQAQIERAVPAWAEVRATTTVDTTAAAALAQVAPGAEVIVVLGTWCGDSKREVPRLWRALEVAGTVPFAVTYLGVDRAKEAPNGVVDGLDARYVPTIIVRRDGAEVGRIIEGATDGVEVALLALLRGQRSGVLSLRGFALRAAGLCGSGEMSVAFAVCAVRGGWLRCARRPRAPRARGA